MARSAVCNSDSFENHHWIHACGIQKLSMGSSMERRHLNQKIMNDVLWDSTSLDTGNLVLSSILKLLWERIAHSIANSTFTFQGFRKEMEDPAIRRVAASCSSFHIYAHGFVSALSPVQAASRILNELSDYPPPSHHLYRNPIRHFL